MIAAVTGFAGIFKDMGLSMATVQREKVTHEQVSTLFWINVALGTTVMLAVMALAPAIAWFYAKPQLLSLAIVMAVSFLFGGLTVQHQALLRRQMRFRALAAIKVTSFLAGVTVGILCALAGLGVWSLVYLLLAEAAFNALAIWVACPWRPGMPKRGAGIRPMLAFGGNLTGFSILNYFARSLDNVLIGKFCGGFALGLYSKAYGLLLLPLRQITGSAAAVAVPTLSRVQTDAERYRRYYLKAIAAISFVAMPGVAFLIVMADVVTDVVLGPKWAGAAWIFAALGAAALVQPVYTTAGWLHVSIGRPDRMLRWALVACPVTVLAFVIGLPFGAMGVAVSYATFNVLAAVPCLWYACRPTPVRLRDVLMVLPRPFLAAVTVALPLVVLRTQFGILPKSLYRLGVAILLGGTAWLCCACAGASKNRPLGFLKELLSEMRPNRKAGRP